MNRTKINKKANIEIAKQVDAKNIRACEIRLPGCLNAWMLERVHRRKRRWYYDKPDELLWDYKQWVIGCHSCHAKIEVDKKLTEQVFLKLRGEEFEEEKMKPIKHIVKEGSREHVVWWDSRGTHCSEPNCEINYREESK